VSQTRHLRDDLENIIWLDFGLVRRILCYIVVTAAAAGSRRRDAAMKAAARGRT
jgi:hypothetical protein